LRKSSRNNGFTLIEVLVAFVILAMILGAVFAAFSTGLTAESRAERVANATLLTRSALAGIGIERPLEEGILEMELESGAFYRLAVRRIEPFAPADLETPGAAAYEITVEAGADGRVDTVLKTVRLGPVE
jgi:general secretion pathway protein I